jgi:hypothetical protein
MWRDRNWRLNFSANPKGKKSRGKYVDSRSVAKKWGVKRVNLPRIKYQWRDGTNTVTHFPVS